MSSLVFYKFKTYIEANIGICIPESKKIMVESRLMKRVKTLGHSSFEEYCDYFFSKDGQKKELPRFIECITTNKTDFFREKDHFDFLIEKAFPEILKNNDIRELRLWSAASSTGEEAYTLSMVTDHYLSEIHGIDFSILATDISEEVLRTGNKAIYSLEHSEPIPLIFKKKYCLHSKDSEKPTIRIKKKLRDKVYFKHINLITESYIIKKEYHIIFLRNVLIYFDKETQIKILNNLYKHLHQNGFLFLGHSEHISDNNIPFRRVGSSVYVKKENI